MPSVLTLAAFLLTEEGGGGLVREGGGAYQKFQSPDGGLIREGDLLERGTY